MLDAGRGSGVLPAEDGIASGGPALGRGVRVLRGVPGHRARHHPGHRADRDHLGRLRDGRDPVRAAGVRRRAERRPVGLPVLDRQDLPGRR